MTFAGCCALHAFISAAIFACVAAVHVPTLRHNMHKSQEVSSLESEGACGTQSADPSILFMHIEKTGGTVMRQMLKAVVPSHKYKMVDGEQPGHLTPTTKKHKFVIGLVRRPCDYLLSRYYMGLFVRTQDRVRMTSLASQQDFKEMVMRSTDETAPAEKKKAWQVDHYLMSKQIEERYGKKGNAHCWMRTHSLKGDFISCMRKFHDCGGNLTVSIADLNKVVESAMIETASDMAKEHSRSVGSHPACTDMFDREMLQSVLKTQRRVIDEFDLGVCCSSDPKSLIRDNASAELSPFFDLDWQID